MESQNQPPAGEKTTAEGKAPQADKAKAKRTTFHVVGPGSVTFGGKNHPAGALLQLTDDEALSLGEAVAEGKAPQAPVAIAKRAGGKYRVAKERSIWHGGKHRLPGFELDCDEAEARSLGDAIEPAE